MQHCCMARPKLSLPHERRKAKLTAQKALLRVRAAETKEQLNAVTAELKAMSPARAKPMGEV